MKHAAIPELRIEHFVSEKSLAGREYDFFITELVNSTLMTVPIRHDFYLLALCTGGSMRITINLHEYRIEPNTLILLSPHQIIHVLEFSQDVRVTNLFFKKQFLLNNMISSPFMDKLQIYKPDACGRISLSKENRKTILTLFALIEEKAASEHPYKREIIKSFIDALLYEIEPVYKNNTVEINDKSTRKEEIMRGFLDLIAVNLYKERSLKFYADKLFISTQYLMEVVKEVSGKTAGDLIDEAVILEARVLLKLPQYNVSMVSDMLNFADQSFFGKYFKRKIGLSPSQYRSLAGHMD